MRKTKPTTYKTLDGLRKQLNRNILTAEQMSNKRAMFKDGKYYNFKVSKIAEDNFWNGIAHVIWRKPSERQIRLLYKASSWMLRNMFYESNGFHYYANQDYLHEVRSIQNYINKL